MDAALAKYPTSLDEDFKILEDKSLTYNIRNCVQLRVGDKKILHFLKTNAEILDQMSSMTRREAIKFMMKNHKSFKHSMKYVKTIFVPLLPEATI